eukprot:scaffold5668_cov111-Isochrysis_galbana.AAC.17
MSEGRRVGNDGIGDEGPGALYDRAKATGVEPRRRRSRPWSPSNWTTAVDRPLADKTRRPAPQPACDGQSATRSELGGQDVGACARGQEMAIHLEKNAARAVRIGQRRRRWLMWQADCLANRAHLRACRQQGCRH